MWRYFSGPAMALLVSILLAHEAPLTAGSSVCNISVGRWVSDSSLPLYTRASCPFGRQNQDCQGRGRRDLAYQKLRWTPDKCALSKFDPNKFANVFKDKVVLIVGDSLVRNFYHATQCLANAGSSKVTSWAGEVGGGTLSGSRVPRTNFRFSYIKSNYLIQAKKGPNGQLSVDSVDLSSVDEAWAKHASGAQVLILQATAWWLEPNRKFYRKNTPVKISSEAAYREALLTVAAFLKRISFRGTVLLLSRSPDHFKLPSGIAKAGTKCQTSRILDSRLTKNALGQEKNGAFLAIERRATHRSNIRLLDITSMSAARPDAHQSKFVPKGWAEDCRHWCEAGVPAAWVEMVYNYFLGKVLSG